jgi:CheY-like chemotaxis protein
MEGALGEQGRPSREELHEALEALYDNVALASAPLLRHFPQFQRVTRVEERAERARAMLFEAIEVLRPARSAPFGSLQARSYDILSLRYVENLPLAEVMKELSLSRRQVYRDLAEAEERLLQVLSSWVAAGREAHASIAPQPPSDELTALAGQASFFPLQPAVAEVVELLQPLLQRTGAQIELESTREEPSVLADRGIFKEIVTAILSAAVQSSPGEKVRLRLGPAQDLLELSISFQPQPEKYRASLFEKARALALAQGITFSLARTDDGSVYIGLLLRVGEPLTLLAVEDNPGAIELYRRLLSGSRWQVVPLASPLLVHESARRRRPDAILLDIIMPGVDGWSIVRALKSDEATSSIPLIVCSVVEDPQLAYALGADVYLPKPVGRAELLAALNRCLRSRPALAQS